MNLVCRWTKSALVGAGSHSAATIPKGVNWKSPKAALPVRLVVPGI